MQLCSIIFVTFSIVKLSISACLLTQSKFVQIDENFRLDVFYSLQLVTECVYFSQRTSNKFFRIARMLILIQVGEKLAIGKNAKVNNFCRREKCQLAAFGLSKLIICQMKWE